MILVSIYLKEATDTYVLFRPHSRIWPVWSEKNQFICLQWIVISFVSLRKTTM